MKRTHWSRTRLTAFLRTLQTRYGYAGSSRIDAASKEAGVDLRRLIRTTFGSLGAAKAAAGLETWPLWTKERLEKEVRRLAGQGIIRSRRFRKEHRRLVAACERHYGSWSAALRHAEVPLEARPPTLGPVKYGHEDVLRILKDAWKRRDVRVNPLRRKHAGIYKATLRIFGTWQSGLKAAGVPPAVYATRMSARRTAIKG